MGHWEAERRWIDNAKTYWMDILAAVVADAHHVNGNRVPYADRARSFDQASARVWIAASESLPVYDALDVHGAIERRMRALRGLHFHRDSRSILERVARSLTTGV